MIVQCLMSESVKTEKFQIAKLEYETIDQAVGVAAVPTERSRRPQVSVTAGDQRVVEGPQ